MLYITDVDAHSRVMPGMQEEAAEKIDAGLRAALAGQAITRPTRQVRDRQQEARDTRRVPRFLVVHANPFHERHDRGIVASLASVAAVKTDAEMRKAPAG